jgi:acyl-CoA reductase-like NAD-dependent aldehyde dehydrogenase
MTWIVLGWILASIIGPPVLGGAAIGLVTNKLLAAKRTAKIQENGREGVVDFREFTNEDGEVLIEYELDEDHRWVLTEAEAAAINLSSMVRENWSRLTDAQKDKFLMAFVQAAEARTEEIQKMPTRKVGWK